VLARFGEAPEPAKASWSEINCATHHVTQRRGAPIISANPHHAEHPDL
jgi:hypothetical protein